MENILFIILRFTQVMRVILLRLENTEICINMEKSPPCSYRVSVWNSRVTCVLNKRSEKHHVSQQRDFKQSKLTNCRSSGCSFSDCGKLQLCENELFCYCLE